MAGRAPDAQSTSSFVNLITTGQFTPVSLTTFTADNELNLAQVDLVGQAQHGIDYLPYAG